jgi:hypothetical protein
MAITAACLGSCLMAGPLPAGEPVALRVESLTVPPATQPLVFVVTRNQQGAAYRGTVSLEGPAGWRLTPPSREIALAPGETKRLPFTIEQGRNVEMNSYPFLVTARGAGDPVVYRQATFVASAPYFQPTIDGNADDWKDAIPVIFETQGKRTTLATYWSRRRFAMLIAVQEAQRSGTFGGPCDAVQVAFWPLEPAADARPDRAGRYEFLLVATGESAKCLVLATPDTEVGAPQQAHPPEPLGDAELAIRRTADVTYYECSLPLKALRDAVRPSEGSEFFWSVVVHDPDDTGLRDLALAAGIWPSERGARRWSQWPGSPWPEQPPAIGKVRWGLCTSKY